VAPLGELLFHTIWQSWENTIGWKCPEWVILTTGHCCVWCWLLTGPQVAMLSEGSVLFHGQLGFSHSMALRSHKRLLERRKQSEVTSLLEGGHLHPSQEVLGSPRFKRRRNDLCQRVAISGDCLPQPLLCQPEFIFFPPLKDTHPTLKLALLSSVVGILGEASW
jgi:hypothetical protein